MEKTKKIEKIIWCPKCRGELNFLEQEILCPACHQHLAYQPGVINALLNQNQYQSENEDSFLFKIKLHLRRFPLFYKFLCHTVGAPVISQSPKKFLKSFSAELTIINIGSGTKIIRPDVINIDIYPYIGVDLVADACQLPIKDKSVDVVICESLIEHLAAPEKLISEIYRVLKQNGQVYLVAPFMLGFHSSPNDYYRWTDQGLIQLLKEFSDIKVKTIYGPTTALVQIFSEWLATVLSFNVKLIHDLWLIILMVIFTPFKYLDYLISHFSSAKTIALGFLVIAKKNG